MKGFPEDLKRLFGAAVPGADDGVINMNYGRAGCVAIRIVVSVPNATAIRKARLHTWNVEQRSGSTFCQPFTLCEAKNPGSENG